MRYRFQTRPYEHQVRAVRKMIKKGERGVALLMDPRTGKTKATVDWLSILAQAGRIDRAVVICPTRVTDVWVQEFRRHSPLNVHTHVWDAEERRNGSLPRVSGRYDLTVVVVNYEAFGVPGKRLPSGRRSRASGRFAARKKLIRWLDGRDAAGVLDEGHKIKSPSGRASNLIVTLQPHFRYRALLTGTPVTKAKRLFDVYMQWKWVNPDRFADLPTVKDFKERYGKWTDRHGYPQLLRTQNESELIRRVHKDSFSVRRADCFDLPPVDEQIVRVPLTSSARVYDDLAEEMISEIVHQSETHTVEASIKLVQMIRLRQITSGIARTDEGRLLRIGTEKLRALAATLEELIEHDEKAVVAAHFKADLTSIARLARDDYDLPVFELRGGMRVSDTDDAIRKFRKISDCALFVMQPQAGSLGIDLSSAARMVWYSLTPSFVNWTQSNDRLALSRRSVTVTYLIAENTVDEIMLEALKEDGDVARKIVTKPERLRRR